MSLNYKITRLAQTIVNYFILPLCWSLSFLSAVIVLGKLNFFSINNLTIIYWGLVFVFIALLISFFRLEERSKLRHGLTLTAPYLFIFFGLYYYAASEFSNPLTTTSDLKITALILTLAFGLLTFFSQGTILKKEEGSINTDHQAIRPDGSNKWRYGVGVILLIVIVIGILLRINGLNHLSLWIDEGTTLTVSERIATGYGQTLLGGEPYPRAYLYHHLLATVLKIFPNPNLAGRLFNLPFFIIICFLIYKFGLLIRDRRVGLLATALFSFSWLGISMTRELRFYEMFLCLFLLFSYLIIKLILTYLDLGPTERKIQALIKNKKIFWFFFTIIIIGLLAFDTLVHTALILYPLIAFGLLLIIFHHRAEGFIIALVSFFILLIATAYNTNQVFFKLSYLITPPEQAWKIGMGDLGFFDFFNYLLTNGYWYLIFIIPLFLLSIIFKKDIRLTYLSCLLFSLYFIVAIQGYGLIALRYYYIVFPFLLLALAYSLVVVIDYFGKQKSRFAYGLLILFCLALIIDSLRGGVQESLSAYNFSSHDQTRNIDYMTVFTTLNELKTEWEKKTGEKILTVTDAELGMPLYANTGVQPDYIYQSDVYATQTRNPYLGVKYIQVDKLSQLDKPSLVILFQKRKYFLKDDRETINPYFLDYFNKNGKKLFDDGLILIYSIEPAAKS